MSEAHLPTAAEGIDRLSLSFLLSPAHSLALQLLCAGDLFVLSISFAQFSLENSN